MSTGEGTKGAGTCPSCGDVDAEVIGRGHDFEYRSLPDSFSVLRCRRCGHGRLDPVPAPEQLATIYPSTYYTINPRSPIYFEGFMRRIKIRRDVDRIVGLAGTRPRSIVDLGCGDADRLVSLRGRLGSAVELVGVDLQPDPGRVAELRRHQIEIAEGNIEDGLGVLADGAHDLMIMCQIIEHLYDPFGAVKTIAKKLAPGGRLLIETPNLGGPDFNRFKDRYWGGYHFPRHFQFFTPRTLAGAVEDAGLKVRSRGFIPSGFAIVSVRNRLGLTSIERGNRFGEFLNMRNLAVVAATTAFDLACIAAGRETSNQFVLAERPA